MECGGDNSLNGEEALEEAKKQIEKAINIFKEVRQWHKNPGKKCTWSFRYWYMSIGQNQTIFVFLYYEFLDSTTTF